MDYMYSRFAAHANTCHTVLASAIDLPTQGSVQPFYALRISRLSTMLQLRTTPTTASELLQNNWLNGRMHNAASYEHGPCMYKRNAEPTLPPLQAKQQQ